jgi:hypothetical protein
MKTVHLVPTELWALCDEEELRAASACWGTRAFVYGARSGGTVVVSATSGSVANTLDSCRYFRCERRSRDSFVIASRELTTLSHDHDSSSRLWRRPRGGGDDHEAKRHQGDA